MSSKCFINFLKYFDYFGIVYTFKIKEKDKYQSRLGGIIFLFFLTFSFYYLSVALIDFCNRTNYNINYSSSVRKPAPILNFSHSGFNFAYSLQDDRTGSYLNLSHLTFLKHSLKLIRQIGGNQSKRNYTSLSVKECENDDLIGIKYTNFTDLSRFYCPVNNSNISISGSFSDLIFDYVQISFEINEEWLNYNNDTDKNLFTISKILRENPIKYVIYWIDTTVDVSNFSTPILNHFRAHAGYLDFEIIQKVNIDFSMVNLLTDSGYFFQSQINYTNITYRETTNSLLHIKDRFNLNLKGNKLGKLFLKIYIRSAPDIFILERSYQKIDIFIANLGGLQTNILLFLYLCINFFNEFWASQKVMNNILKFREHLKASHPEQFKILKTNLRSSFKSNSKTITENLELSKEQPTFIPDLSLNKEKNYPDIKDYEKRQMDKTGDMKGNSSSLELNIEMRNRPFTQHHLNIKLRQEGLIENNEENILSKSKRPLNFNSFEIIWRYCPCKTKRQSLQNKFYEKASKKMVYYFDIYSYIKKMQEIDIIKYLLLNKDQVKLFNFISRPSVSMSYSDSDDIYQDIQKNRTNKMKIEELEEIINCHKLLKDTNEDLNNKLIYLFDYEIDHLLIG